jgi:hypothetical protein
MCQRKEFDDEMDATAAIEIHRTALIRILAGLLALAGYAEGSMAARLPQAIYRAVLRILRPMESAVRRLIVVAAQGLAVKLDPPRSGRKGGGTARKGNGGRAPAFKLFDTRKRFDFKPRRRFAKVRPRAWSVDTTPDPRVPWYAQFQAAPNPVPVQLPSPAPQPEDGTVDAYRLGRRLAAVKMALEDIPRQALRMARWMARRKAMPKAKFASPLRIGAPPGHRKSPRDEIDRVLKECHALAREALFNDTS